MSLSAKTTKYEINIRTIVDEITEMNDHKIYKCDNQRKKENERRVAKWKSTTRNE